MANEVPLRLGENHLLRDCHADVSILRHDPHRKGPRGTHGPSGAQIDVMDLKAAQGLRGVLQVTHLKRLSLLGEGHGSTKNCFLIAFLGEACGGDPELWGTGIIRPFCST